MSAILREWSTLHMYADKTTLYQQHAQTNIYTIRDSKAQTYIHHFFSKTNGTAIREFLESTANKDNAEDYCLYFVGQICSLTGVNVGLEAPVLLGTPSEIAVPEPTQPSPLTKPIVDAERLALANAVDDAETMKFHGASPETLERHADLTQKLQGSNR